MLDQVNNKFHPGDYAVFVIMLVVSMAIGVYFVIRQRMTKENTETYLLAGRNMNFLPVAISMSVTFLSAIALLGIPAEVYRFGTMSFWMIPAQAIAFLVITKLYIPTYYGLGVSSTYEYLELRFNRLVRMIGTLDYIILTVLYSGIVLYMPALALNEVTGLNLWGVVIASAFVCIAYTILGGLKAVLWTDVFQGTIILIGMIGVLAQGSKQKDGFENIWQIAKEGERIQFGYAEGDPRFRLTVWGVLTGSTFIFIGMYAVSHSEVQRYLCCKTETHAKAALWLSFVFTSMMLIFSIMSGLIIYAVYHDCDPLSYGLVHREDQLLPYLVMDILAEYPGMPGLFVACVYSGSLSTISSSINALSCVTLEDLIKPWTSWSSTTYLRVSKGLVAAYGVLCLIFALLASQLGILFEAAASIFGLLYGPLVGLFTLAIIFPFANWQGVTAGLFVGQVINIWLYAGARAYPPRPEFVRPLPVTTLGCPGPAPPKLPLPAIDENRPNIADTFYALSFWYYICVGFAVCLAVGIIVSLLTGGHKNPPTMNPLLVRPIFQHRIFSILPNSMLCALRCGRQSWAVDDVSLENSVESLSMASPPIFIRDEGKTNLKNNGGNSSNKNYSDVFVIHQTTEYL